VNACTIRPATAADAEALAAFGERAFRDAFGPDNLPHNIEHYVRTAYGAPIQLAELQDPHIITLVAVEAEGALTAYAQVRAPRPAPGRPDDNSAEVWRFYVDRPWQGQGLATQLMGAVREVAIDLGCDALWLAVWEDNPRAIAFYNREGFRQVGSQPFQLGDDLQTDLVMVTSLNRGDRWQEHDTVHGKRGASEG
jgi:ribosomal protein S18 acetylase RimI-like enzyme